MRTPAVQCDPTRPNRAVEMALAEVEVDGSGLDQVGVQTREQLLQCPATTGHQGVRVLTLRHAR
jgi:hypothetical protein